MTLNPNSPDDFWIQEFKNWLDHVEKADFSSREDVWKRMKDKWDTMGNNKSLGDLFQEKDFRDAYANLFRL
jgi:hypothetical protein